MFSPKSLGKKGKRARTNTVPVPLVAVPPVNLPKSKLKRTSIGSFPSYFSSPRSHSSGQFTSGRKQEITYTPAPNPADYQLLAFLCKTDTDTRNVFDKSQHESSTTLGQSNEQKLQQYSQSPFIDKDSLIAMILLLDQTLFVVQNKYKTMHAVGALLNYIFPIEKGMVPLKKRSQHSLLVFKKLKQPLDTFIQKCIDIESHKGDPCDTGFEVDKLPKKIKVRYLSEDNPGRKSEYQHLNEKLLECVCSYHAAVKRHQELKEKLNSMKKSDLLKTYHEYEDHYTRFLMKEANSDKNSGRKRPIVNNYVSVDLKLDYALFKRYNNDFTLQLSQWLNPSNPSPQHEQYVQILKQNKQLMPVSHQIQSIFMKKSFLETLHTEINRLIEKLDNNKENKDIIISTELEKMLQKYLTEKIMLIEKSMLSWLTNEDVWDVFSAQKAKFGYKSTELIPWSDIREENPFLSILPIEEEKASSSSSHQMLANLNKRPGRKPIERCDSSHEFSPRYLNEQPQEKRLLLDLTKLQPLTEGCGQQSRRLKHLSLDFKKPPVSTGRILTPV